jgi:hypothetical protein
MSGADSLQCELRNGGLIIRVFNRNILEKMEATIQAIAELIRSHRAKAALVDMRGVPGEATFMDRYEMGRQAGDHLPRIPVAVLLHEPLADPQRIGETVARNRGANVEVFTDPASAEAWFDRVTA